MKCPWCENIMTEGYINSARQVVFSERQNEDFFYFGSKEDVKLTQYNWTRPCAKAFHCENCKKVVVDYDVEIE